ncbi:MAG: hypothetical protein HQK55_03930 [Deltaproteobacteria bacterium]|nr:hypothetical protein [Deltaproteobacteria bacterium]
MTDYNKNKQKLSGLAASLRGKADKNKARPATTETLVRHLTHSSMKCGAAGCNLIEANE